ncbi:MAG: helix-turn-helix transcriptional regulator [Minicystis sp.]
MPYREIEPHPALRPFVDRLWTNTGAEPGNDTHPAPRRILPDGCIDVLLHLADGGRAVVVGTMTQPFLAPAVASGPIAAVRFRPGGAAPFLRLSAHELTDRHVDASDLGHTWLSDPRAADPRDSSPRETTVDAAVRRLEKSLLAQLSAIRSPEPLIAHAVALLFAPDAPPVEALARRIGWSRQHLARAFRAHIGIGPKQLSRVARMQRAIEALQRGRAVQPSRSTGLAAAAVGLGYFDEAHMALDFRELVGLTPAAVRAARGSLFPIRSLLHAPYGGA